MPSAALPTPDTWLDIVTGTAAILGGSAVVVGGVLACLFGRRASVSVSAEVHETPSGFVIAARPTVKAVGIFRVSFGETKGTTVRLTESYIDQDSHLQEGQYWELDSAFGQQYVDPGEELPTSVVFQPVNPAESVIGWFVFLRISAPTRLGRLRTAWWADQVFVARPSQGSLSS